MVKSPGAEERPKNIKPSSSKIEMSSYSRVCWVVSLLFRTNTLFPSNTQTVLGCSKNKRFQRKNTTYLLTGKVSIRNREFGDGSFLGLNIINFSYFPGMPWRPLRNIRKQKREKKCIQNLLLVCQRVLAKREKLFMITS